MRNSVVVDAYMKHKGVVMVKGSHDNLSPLLFYFLTDCSQQVFDKNFKDLPLKREAKKLRNEWKDAYRRFNNDFWNAFDGPRGEMTNFLCDKMDAFNDYIAHDIYIAKIAIMESCNEFPMQIQEQIANCWLCNLLAKDAQDMHSEIYCTSRRQKENNRDIDCIIKKSEDFSKYIYDDTFMTEKQFNRIQLAVKVLAKKIVNWVCDDYMEDIKENKK